MKRIISFLLCTGTVVFAQGQQTSLMADRNLKAIVNEASGDLDLDTIIALGRFHRVPATPGFNQGADYAAALGGGRGGDNGIITYDALNLVDGRRSIAQIRDILSAAYRPVTEEFVYQYLKRTTGSQSDFGIGVSAR